MRSAEAPIWRMVATASSLLAAKAKGTEASGIQKQSSRLAEIRYSSGRPIAKQRKEEFMPQVKSRLDRMPRPPAFATPAEERRHRKERLAGAFRLFSKCGFDEGVAGHITARDPEKPDHFWVNPFGMHFKMIRVKDLILVNDRGEVIDSEWPVNTAAFAIHSQVHAARPDVIAAAHAHSVYGKSWSSLRRLPEPLTQDACAFYGDHALFDDYTGVVLD